MEAYTEDELIIAAVLTDMRKGIVHQIPSPEP